jgi:hypothetical protein
MNETTDINPDLSVIKLMCCTPTQVLPNTICVGHHYTQSNTINVNKTWALLQTSGGKDEPNIIYLEIVADNTHGTQDVKKHNMTTQKTKKMSNTDTTIKSGMNSGAREG